MPDEVVEGSEPLLLLSERISGVEGKLGALLQMATQNYDQAEEAHKRLRGDIRETKILVESNFNHFDTVTGLLKAQVAALQLQAQQPVDARRITLSATAIISIVVTVVSLVGLIYGFKSSVEAKMTTLGADIKDAGKAQDSSLKAEVSSVRSDLKDMATAQREISSRIDSQKETQAAAIKAQDAQLSALKDSIALTQKQADASQRQGELLRFEFQTLKETVLGKKGGDK